MKIAGTRRAFKEVFPSDTIDVVGVEVNNVVGKQPIGIDATFLGALNRALGARERVNNADYFVGIEAGIFCIHTTWIDVQIAVVMDKNGKLGIGLSPGFPLPKKFLTPILHQGKELEEIVDSHYGTHDIGSHGGLIKLLTKDLIDREDLVYYAVLTALIPWMNSELYFSL